MVRNLLSECKSCGPRQMGSLHRCPTDCGVQRVGAGMQAGALSSDVLMFGSVVRRFAPACGDHFKGRT